MKSCFNESPKGVVPSPEKKYQSFSTYASDRVTFPPRCRTLEFDQSSYRNIIQAKILREKLRSKSKQHLL